MTPATANPPLAQTPYDRAFFDEQARASGRSAEAMVPLVMQLVRPASVLDVGCGVGAWLAAFAAAGVTDYLGLDGEYVDRSKLLIDPVRFRPADLTKSLAFERTFDLAMCLEVGEHLPRSRAPGLVKCLTAASEAVFFSAAFPGQGGTHHVNEQWPAFWRGLFADNGYVRLDPFRHQVWRDSRVKSWYKLNTFLFVRESSLASRPEWTAEYGSARENPYELVSAWHLERNLPVTFRRALVALPVAAWRALVQRFH